MEPAANAPLDGPEPQHQIGVAVFMLLANLTAGLVDLITIEAHQIQMRSRRRPGRVMARYTPLRYPELESSRAHVESLCRLVQAQRRA